MPFFGYKATNEARAQLLTNISAGAVVVVVKSGQGSLFPSTFPFKVKMEKYDVSGNVTKREFANCTARTGDSLTITRASEACPSSYTATTQTSTAFAFDADDYIFLIYSADSKADQDLEIARLETAKLNLAGGTLTGTLLTAQGATIASAGTVNLATATGNSLTISGTTTITSFGTVTAGAQFTLTFSGILTLTHNATSLILPGTANITTGVGDVLHILSLGGGNWRCTGYERADGSALVTSTTTKFGGTGSDGVLNISSGTTNIDLTGLAFFDRNYTSISITGTGALTFTNPNANGTVISLKSSGNVTITSSATRAIDVRGLGAPGGSGGPGGGNAGNSGSTDPEAFSTGHGGGGAPGVASNLGGSAGTVFSNNVLYSTLIGRLRLRRNIWLVTGSGGGGGGSRTQAGGTAAGGAGARGGGVLLIECNGAYNVTGTIDVSGNVGSVGAVQAGNPSSGGGGGGAGGYILALFNILTTNTGTYTVAGGIGGIGGQGTGTNREAGGGGGGGGNINNPGIIGGSGSLAGTGNSIGGNGGQGGLGLAISALNTIFN